MKILSVSWNVFEYKNEGYIPEKNGGSIMISDIAEYIGRIVDSYLYVGNIRTGDAKVGHINLCSNKKYLPEHRTKENINEWQEGLKKGFIELVEQSKPDYVLVHGAGDFAYSIIDICIEKKIKVAFVCHLYLGKKEGLDASKEELDKEDKIFEVPDLKIITVGTGMRSRILKERPAIKEENIVAIINGTKIEFEPPTDKFIDLYKSVGKKVLVCSGSLQPRKNQIQLVRACGCLRKDVLENIEILLVGKDSKTYPTKDMLLQAIADNGLQDVIKYLGVFEQKEMKNIYSIMDGLIMPSFAEGVSLVALEALTFGKPIIAFYDNETLQDVNDSRAVVEAKNHSDKALAEAIEEWYDREWDEEFILNYSKKFRMERVAQEYVDFCLK